MRYRLLKMPVVQLDGSLREAIQQAIAQCPGENEEEGGFIVQNGEKYEFHHLVNQHTGTPVGVALYEPDQQQYGDRVIGSYSRGFINFGSFHTHPTGCRALPSGTDLTRLFNGQPNNFIWSPSLKELNWFAFDGNDGTETSWFFQSVDLSNLSIPFSTSFQV